MFDEKWKIHFEENPEVFDSPGRCSIFEVHYRWTAISVGTCSRSAAQNNLPDDSESRFYFWLEML